MKKFIIFSNIILLSFACNYSRFRDYNKLNKGFYLRLIEIGELQHKANAGDYVTADLVYRKMNDSLFFSGNRKFRLEQNSEKVSFSQGISMLSEGDSASFIINTEDFFLKTIQDDIPGYLEGDKFIKIDVRIIDIQSPEEYEKEKQLFLDWVREFRMSEFDIIRQYFSDNEIEVAPEANGIYFLSHTKGEGPPVTVGKRVSLHYEGKFLNGKFVDSTREGEEPLDFVYGQEMYLIDGLNYAIGQMNQGGKAVILIPSEQAYGPSGSYKGIIPPFTALIYEVEILKVE